MLEKMELRDYFHSQDRTGIGPERTRIAPDKRGTGWGMIGRPERMNLVPGRSLVFMIYRIIRLTGLLVSIRLTRTHPRGYNLTVIHI